MECWHTVHWFTVCDSKAIQMNVQHSLIWKLMLYEFKLGHNAMEISKKHLLCESWRHSTVTRWFKEFCSGCKNLDDQARSSRLETWFWGHVPSHRDKLSISQSTVVSPLHDLEKSIWSCQIMPQKILLNFWLSQLKQILIIYFIIKIC